MMRAEINHRVVGSFLILVCVSLCALAQTPQPTAATDSRERPRTGAITGRVVNDSGQPLPNVAVYVRSPGARGAGQVAASNREGFFKLTGLEPLSYEVIATLPGYTSKPRESASGTPPQYRIGDSVTLVLVKGGVIAGTVTRPNGDPVVGIAVRVRMIRDYDDRPVTNPGATLERTTDDRGVYRIYGLPAGTYIVVADGTNDNSGTGVNAFAGEVPTYAPSTNRETAAEITVRAGEEASNVDIRYRGERGRTISGIVSGLSADQRFSVVLHSVVTREQEWTVFSQEGSREFVFEGIPDGDYYVIAISYLKDGERGMSNSRVLNVRGDLAGLELSPLPLASISGRVLFEDSKAPECTDKRRPVFSETFVSAWHRDTPAARKQAPLVWSMGVPVSANEQGNLTLRTLAPSDYYFAVRFSAKDWYVQSITFARPPAQVDATRTWTTVKAGDRLSGLTVTLAQGGASLHGQAALDEGEALPDKLVVYLVPVEREKSEDVLRYFAVAVTPDGKITLNNVAPGRYWVLAQSGSDDAQSPLNRVRVPDATEKRVSLRRAAEAAKNEIELKPCQHITGFRLPL